jgi:LysR family transcriptional regulator, glycine cleavage system transcriptional activator
MTRRYLPSLSALQAFEAAARHLSFTRAAEELNVTQSAISRQVRHLEEFLGQSLFMRIRHKVVLTPSGQNYLPEIHACLDRIESATVQLLASGGTSGVLNIALLPTFGTKWLIPRLPGFTRANPGIIINFTTKTVPFDFAGEDIDAAIHFGSHAWAGAMADRLMGEEVVPVCSPRLLQGPSALRTPADLARFTLLQHTTRPRAWQDWLEAAGVGTINGFRGPRFEHLSMAVQAAIADLGIAVMPRFLVEEEVRTGQLVVPFDVVYRDDNAYYLVYPENRRELPKLRVFREWLIAEARKPARTLAPTAL